MSWNRGTFMRTGGIAMVGIALVAATYSCQDDGENGGSGGTTTSGTGGSGGATGGSGGATGGSGAGGDEACVRCAAAFWDDSASTETLCETNGPPSSQDLYDALAMCACGDEGPCVTKCSDNLCNPASAVVEQACELCLPRECFVEHRACIGDKDPFCNNDDGCTVYLEDCGCSDCSGTSFCIADQCITDDICTLDDACTCPDCATDVWCSDPEICHDDGECYAFWEGCHCADCVDEANCQGQGGGGGSGGGN